MRRIIHPAAGVTLLLAFAALLAFGQQQAAKELIKNGNFESQLAGWSSVSEGNAKGTIQLEREMPLDPASPHSLKIEAIELGERCGAANSGEGGMNITAGAWYDATFSARIEGTKGIGLLFSLETEDGRKICARTTLPEVGRGEIGDPIAGHDRWRKYVVSLHAYASDARCRLVISPIEPATVYLDELSLKQRAAVSQ